MYINELKKSRTFQGWERGPIEELTAVFLGWEDCKHSVDIPSGEPRILLSIYALQTGQDVE